MADELQMKDLQMKGLTEKLTDMLGKVSKSKRKELDLQDINARLKEFQMALDGANIEMRHLGNHPAKVELKQMLREHKAALKELQTEYQTKRAALLKTELLGDHVEDTGERDTAESLMERGLDVQAASKESLARTLATIERTKDVGADTVLKLEANTKQVEAMYDELEMIESSLQRSSKIIRRIARKMATDKYVWVMIILLLCVIIIVVVMNQLKKKSSGDEISSSSTGVAGPSGYLGQLDY